VQAVEKTPSCKIEEFPELILKILDGWNVPRQARAVIATKGFWANPWKGPFLQEKLHGRLKSVHVVSDMEAAHLASFAGEPGVVVLAGTGSVVFGINRAGKKEKEGGLGPLKGDEGSAYWIAKTYLSATGGKIPATVKDTAALAKDIIFRAEKGEPLPLSVITLGQLQLAMQAAALSDRLALRGQVRLSWTGSVMNNPFFRKGFLSKLKLLRPALVFKPMAPTEEPVVAAAKYAMRKH